MITKNFREELPIVEWFEGFSAIVNGREMIERDITKIHDEIKRYYGGEIRRMDEVAKVDLNKGLELNKEFMSQFNIKSIYEKGHLLNISFDSNDGDEICYIVNKEGFIVRKGLYEIRFEKFNWEDRF